MNIFAALGNLIEAIFSGFSGLLIGFTGLAMILSILMSILGPQHKRENFKEAFVIFLILFVIGLLIKGILVYVQTNAIVG